MKKKKRTSIHDARTRIHFQQNSAALENEGLHAHTLLSYPPPPPPSHSLPSSVCVSVSVSVCVSSEPFPFSLLQRRLAAAAAPHRYLATSVVQTQLQLTCRNNLDLNNRLLVCIFLKRRQPLPVPPRHHKFFVVLVSFLKHLCSQRSRYQCE